MGARTLQLPRLNAIVDEEAAHAAGWTVADLARACLAGGARFLQIRAKRLASRAYLAVCDEVVSLARERNAIVIVNNRADIARLCGATGVHLGQDDLTPEGARTVIGRAALVGLSTHTPDQIRAALLQPVDYIAVGPIFGTLTKETGYGGGGLDLVRTAATIARAARERDPDRPGVPLVAIGGITLERARDVLEAGADSVAVISDLFATRNPEARAREYLQLLR